MRQFLSRLWNDDCGALLAVEWVFVATILVLGSITGLVAVRQAILAELHEFAEALRHLSHAYHIHGFRHGDLDDEAGFADDDGDSHGRHQSPRWARADDDEDEDGGMIRGRSALVNRFDDPDDSLQ
jgi:hypothetical protein